MKKNLAFLIFNFLGLQTTWAACAYGATHGGPMLGVYVGISYVILHFIFSEMRTRDLKIMLIIAVLGVSIDCMLKQLNMVSFPHYDSNNLLIPLWLIALWFVFALMVPYSLYWLKKNLKVACIAGAIGGSFSYYLGHKLGALQLAEPLIFSVSAYFIFWGAIFPLALKIVEHFTLATLKPEATTS